MHIQPIETTIAQQIVAPPSYTNKLSQNDFARMSEDKFLNEIHNPDHGELYGFRKSWDDLSMDTYMADGGKYRLRRHGTYSATRAGGHVERMPHAPHYQATKFNDLNGGVERHFDPIKDHIADGQVLFSILNFCSRTFGTIAPLCDWHIEVHQFRILAKEDGGKPTPEGLHRDGVDFVMMALIARSNVTDGETQVVDMYDREVARFTLTQPFEAVMVNDLRVAHGVSPILPASKDEPGYRDMLVVTFKRR